MARINFISTCIPKNSETNSELSSQLGLSEEDSVFKKIGFQKRRVSITESGLSMALNAVEKVLRFIDVESVKYIIYCTETPDYLIPPNSYIVHSKFTFTSNVVCFDYNLGCSGYTYGLYLSKLMLGECLDSKVLLITSDTYSKNLSKNDKNCRLIFGDGATATIISNSDDGYNLEIVSEDFYTNGADYKNLILNNGSNFDSEFGEKMKLFMAGREVFNFTLEQVPNSIDRLLSKNLKSKNEVDLYLLHQANKYMLENIARKMKVPTEKVPFVLGDVGNTVSGSLPMLMDTISKELLNLSQNKFIIVSGFGVGLSVCSLLLVKK